MIQVSQNVYVETGIFACNLGVITTKEGNILVDTPERPSDAVRWRDEVGKKGEVRYLINTEEHPDHAHSSRFLPGILITHEKTRERLAKLPVEEILERVKGTDPEGLPFMEGFRLRLADITFSESLSLFLGGQTVKLFHLPGHSEGGMAVYIPAEKVVFTTDIVFHRRKSWLHEATPSRWLESLKKLRELDVDVIVPGHGDLCKKDYLDEQAAVVEKWVDAVRSAIEKGLSEEEAVAKISPPDPHPKQPKTPMTEEQLNRAIISRLYHLYAK
ncbi:MAG: MBL fold metallo-hydrolase [Proteobacteria bacterium]|nr:MBL fold metallo-hydrolase [Pseudomonadota bacterium]